MLLNLLAGLVLGFLGSTPVAGPISVLVLALGMENQTRKAAGVAAGGAVAEALYAFLAFWGSSQFLARTPVLTLAARGVSALILLAVGLRLIRQNTPGPRPHPVPAAKHATKSGILLGFTVAILNPTLLLTWMAASAVVFSSPLFTAREADPLFFSAGVGGGIVSWFCLLLWLVARARGSFHPDRLSRMVRWIGWAVLLGAAVLFAQFAVSFLSRGGSI